MDRFERLFDIAGAEPEAERIKKHQKASCLPPSRRLLLHARIGRGWRARQRSLH